MIATSPDDLTHGCVNLASARLGAAGLAASDAFFAPLERMLQDAPAVFHPDRYDAHGKWMDGWETRRRRGPGHDWAVIRLAAPGVVAAVDVDTAHFTGNYPPAAQVWGWAAPPGGPADPPQGAAWSPLTPMIALGPDARHPVPALPAGPVSHVRLDIHPDGGVARLRVWGRPTPPAPGAAVELSGALLGGRVIGWSNAHYGAVQHVLYPDRGITMGDGWETRRLRAPGNDWLVVALGARGTVERVVVDTTHNKGNFPESCSLQAADMGAMGAGLDAAVVTAAMFWPELCPRAPLGPDAAHAFDPVALGPVTHLRLNIFPDGGISRLRAFGRAA